MSPLHELTIEFQTTFSKMQGSNQTTSILLRKDVNKQSTNTIKCVLNHTRTKIKAAHNSVHYKMF